MTPEQLSQELREESGHFLEQRRAIIGLSVFTTAVMSLIGLYQTGIIPHLPDPPLPRIRSDEVDASAEAYERFNTPDALLGMSSYATTAVLAGMGGKERAHEKPWIPLAMAGKIAFDAFEAVRLTVVQWRYHRAFCFWCLLSAVATFITAPLAFPEARAAWRHLRRRYF